MLLRLFRASRIMQGKRILSGDDTGRPVARDIVRRPLDQDKDLVAELNQTDEMHEQPGQPGEEAGKANPAQVDDRGIPSDRGHAAAVLEVKRRQRTPPYALLNQVGRVTP